MSLSLATGAVAPLPLELKHRLPHHPQDPRVRVNEERVGLVAEILSTLAEVSLCSFTGPTLPSPGHPEALDYFFAMTLQQFSFFTIDGGRYHLPLIATIDGVERKGSDYLMAAYTRQLEREPEFCSAERQATLTREELLDVLRADDGRDPMPALGLHLQLAREYGQDMLSLQLTPRSVLDRAHASKQPLKTFLLTLDQIGGYKEDPLRKKSLLLAMILKDRPEAFLSLGACEEIAPIVDYHLMRSFLRIGLVDVVDVELETGLANRQLVTPAEEWAVRFPVYLAMGQLVAQSGRGLNAVNQFFFSNARQRCPELTEPQCWLCALEAVCARRKAFFQPVLRTTFY